MSGTTFDVHVVLVQKIGNQFINFIQPFHQGVNTICFTAELESYIKICQFDNNIPPGTYLDDVQLEEGSQGSDGIVDHHVADLKRAQDYYPFGMPMPGRSLNPTSYRFGFNGMEKDDEGDDNAVERLVN